MIDFFISFLSITVWEIGVKGLNCIIFYNFWWTKCALVIYFAWLSKLIDETKYKWCVGNMDELYVHIFFFSYFLLAFNRKKTKIVIVLDWSWFLGYFQFFQNSPKNLHLWEKPMIFYASSSYFFHPRRTDMIRLK